MSDRLEKLKKMLEQKPEDPFLLYGIAMELKKTSAPEALQYLERVTQADPNYCYAYHQKGLIHESRGDVEAARRAYRDGIEAAVRSGDAHARSEIEGALSMIE